MINYIYNFFIIAAITSVLCLAIISGFYVIRYQNSIQEANRRLIKNPLGIICIVILILSFLSLTFIKNRMTEYAMDEINSILKESPQVYINGKIYNQDILTEIKNITPNAGSRVWSDTVISIKLVKNTTFVELKAVRNNEDSTLYRIYYPKYDLTKLNAIGEIKTKRLSNY